MFRVSFQVEIIGYTSFQNGKGLSQQLTGYSKERYFPGFTSSKEPLIESPALGVVAGSSSGTEKEEFAQVRVASFTQPGSVSAFSRLLNLGRETYKLNDFFGSREALHAIEIGKKEVGFAP